MGKWRKAISEPDKQRINEIIYTELVRGMLTDESRQAVLAMVERLSAQGADAVVLGCTEIPLLVKQEHTKVPLIDTTTLQAQRALDLALERPVDAEGSG